MTLDEKLKLLAEYPDETEGSRIAAQARRLSGKLSREERRRLFHRAMVRIHGGLMPDDSNNAISQPRPPGYLSLNMTIEEKLQKISEYPDDTVGSRLAAEARRDSSKLSREERKQLFREAMVMIYGGKLQETPRD